jgi:hypothetical protein
VQPEGHGADQAAVLVTEADPEDRKRIQREREEKTAHHEKRSRSTAHSCKPKMPEDDP